ncbi:uncharacterized protein LOC113359410 [Papaver somniferum]|uniref:uncharacterized protein LOC113359410 n=1 Tax=Papaver somniferum TaxID=3469 RepID=UPI000E6FC7D7|nr:uncharacterized protein LOC113359410 [Papaver somniferum]
MTSFLTASVFINWGYKNVSAATQNLSAPGYDRDPVASWALDLDMWVKESLHSGSTFHRHEDINLYNGKAPAAQMADSAPEPVPEVLGTAGGSRILLINVVNAGVVALKWEQSNTRELKITSSMTSRPTKICSEGVEKKRHEDINHYEEKAPRAKMVHPWPEHFYLLHVALGAAGEEAKAELVHHSWREAALSYVSYRFKTTL